jgi:UDP-N-acetylglucosamine 2-epimerase (non-hydrolysing)
LTIFPAVKKVVSVVGARPNFMKFAAVFHALREHEGVDHLVVHTGQHYDPSMSGRFFDELDIPPPTTNLDVGSATQAKQTAAVMERLEPVLERAVPDWVLVYGDVNSTVAAALVAVKLGIKVAHVEAGLRSRDRTMPEEHNRVVTDHLADLLFTPSRDAVAILRQEGIPAERIAFVGNVMIDTLIRMRPAARGLGTAKRWGLPEGGYVLVTLHRPANVDDPGVLVQLCEALAALACERPVVFPVHPRTRARLEAPNLARCLREVRLLEPVPYLQMLDLTESAEVVLTDSGGVQEETTFLGVPCLTVRPNTERPITLTQGTNQLVQGTPEAILAAVSNGLCRRATQIERWDGKAGERIAAVLCEEVRFE